MTTCSSTSPTSWTAGRSRRSTSASTGRAACSCPSTIEVDGHEHAARPVDALVDLRDRPAVHEVGDVELQVVIDLGRARSPGESEGVLESAGDEHAYAR